MTATVNRQPVRALQKANRHRVNRAQLKQQLCKAGARQGAFAIARTIQSGTVPPSIEHEYVFKVLMWVPRLGEMKAEFMLKRAGISPWTRMSALTDRQRRALVVFLAEFARSRSENSQPKRRRSSPNSTPSLPADPLRCCQCGNPLREPAVDGRCGLCVEEDEQR